MRQNLLLEPIMGSNQQCMYSNFEDTVFPQWKAIFSEEQEEGKRERKPLPHPHLAEVHSAGGGQLTRGQFGKCLHVG